MDRTWWKSEECIYSDPGIWKGKDVTSLLVLFFPLTRQVLLFSLYIQLTLEQHEFELHRSTYMWIFLLSGKHYSITQFSVGWIQRCRMADMEEPQIRRNLGYKYIKFVYKFDTMRKVSTSASTLFKGQLYTPTLKYTRKHTHCENQLVSSHAHFLF